MSVRRDKRTGRWYFRTRARNAAGNQVRLFGTPGVPGPYHDLPNTKMGALEAERRAIADAVRGDRVVPRPDAPTVRAYVEPFLTGYAAAHKPSSQRDKKQRLNADILPHVGDRRIDSLLQADVDAIVAALLKRGRSRKGINTSLSVLSSLVRYAVSNRLLADPALRFCIKAQSAELEALAADDVVKLAAVADVRYRAAILLAADAGLRIGEIRALAWLDVNEVQRELTIARSYDRARNLTETKGWERRTVPIGDRLWAALRALGRVGELVFCRLDGGSLGYDCVRDRLHELYVAAGVDAPAQPWHALRHTFGTELANRGTPPHVIRILMGHKSLDTTLRYLHVDRAAKRAAVSTLGSHRAAEPKVVGK